MPRLPDSPYPYIQFTNLDAGGAAFRLLNAVPAAEASLTLVSETGKR